MKKTRKGIQDWILYFILPIVIILIWQYMSSTGKIKSYAMPSPMGIVSVTLEYIKNGELWDGIVISFLRVLEGFLTALITAFILGIAVSLFQKIEVLTDYFADIKTNSTDCMDPSCNSLVWDRGRIQDIYYFYGSIFPCICKHCRWSKKFGCKIF